MATAPTAAVTLPGRNTAAQRYSVGQQRYGVLCIRPQPLIGDKQERPIFPERESERASKLLAIQRILDGYASGGQAKVCEARIEGQRGTKRKMIARIQGVITEEADNACRVF
jgi:hypothetical protein